MATGYTAILTEKPDTTFKEFVLRCARACGACIMQRDDSLVHPPKMDKVESYHADRLKQAQKEFAEFQQKNDQQLMQEFLAYKARMIKVDQERLEEKQQLRTTYTNMLTQVYAWTPPSPDHVELKNFMIQQLQDSIKWDCNTKYTVESLEYWESLQFHNWLKKERQHLEDDIEYHTKHLAEDTLNTLKRNQWKQQLFDSLS